MGGQKLVMMENFVGYEATVVFLFDVMNSKYTFGKFSKAPLKISNQQEWENTLTRCERYINGLSLMPTDRVCSLEGDVRHSLDGQTTLSV